MRLGGESPGGAAEKRPEGERREARGQVGMLVTSHLRVRPLWASDLRGLVVEGCVHARQCPRTCGILWECTATREARAGGLLCFTAEPHPFLPRTTHFTPPPRQISKLRIAVRVELEQVSGVKLLGVGGSGSVVEAGDKDPCQRGSGSYNRQPTEVLACPDVWNTPFLSAFLMNPLSFLHFSFLETCLLDFL